MKKDSVRKTIEDGTKDYFKQYKDFALSEDGKTLDSEIIAGVNAIQNLLECCGYTLYSIHYTLYNIHYTIYKCNINFTIYSIQYTLYSIHYTICTIQCTIYSISYTIYTIQYTV